MRSSMPSTVKIFTLGICLAGALSTIGCAEHLERKDTITSYSGDSVARNIAVHTIHPSPYRARHRHIHHDGQRMARAIDKYQKPPTQQAKKSVIAPKISDF